ncbi:MAG: DoxX family membrane protein [Candidatus Marinimicrobia bacterium]|nr:DoxX family membrane protein [Candidatus Neomarinimicrobiota bacterium]MBL7059534.1 DoxX family membrane protein [Candidatus Neomarinimicrobiota bacterium]
MNRILSSKLIILFARFVVGGIFLYASFDKIANPGAFARSIENYHMLPFGLENMVAIILPWIEFFVGLALIFGFLIDGAALISMGMMMFFIIAITSAILRGYNIDCGCGLREGEIVGISRLIEDAGYLFLSWAIYRRKNTSFEIGNVSV